MPVLDYYISKIPDGASPELRRLMIEDAKRKVEIDVFGEGFKRDKNGKPIEQGLGSASNPTQTCVDAYALWGKNEAGYSQHLAFLKKQLSDFQARKAAVAAIEP